MFSSTPVMKIVVLLCFIAAATASPIFFGHGKQTQFFLTSRKDTVKATPQGINQIPTVLVKAKPAAAVNLKVPVKLPVKVPLVARPAVLNVVTPQHVTQPKTPYEINKLFNEMKNSKKPFMTIQMKAPAKQSMFPDPFSLFDDDNSEHIVVHVPYNVHTHNIHHHHIQAVPVYKPVPIIKHVPVHVVKEVAIPVHLSHYKEEGWSHPEPQWW